MKKEVSFAMEDIKEGGGRFSGKMSGNPKSRLKKKREIGDFMKKGILKF